MQRVLITGLSGTLGPVVAEYFRQQGLELVVWNHHQVSPQDAAASEQFWQANPVDAICHLAMGSEDWAAWLAAKAAQANIPYVFTSTAMVFDAAQPGPYSIFAERNAVDEYGKYKIRCEDAIWQANPDAMIARLGWQINDQRGGNNMFDQLCQQFEQNGVIEASSEWFPATSHMRDTAAGLYQLLSNPQPGLFHFDSNAEQRLSFYQLVCSLKAHFDTDWVIKANQDYVHDQRLLEERVAIAPLSAWLG
ncbi:sugar nucleotide-binding protein [Aliagarivorans marinus]|uniref:sugar nucleotide-binding protein n=1 Tax=Aliagarivorans marinus TaxID=561965 RepID=UPI00055271E9|nr:sugar nucleotide-binding protein [Aliagarivorans marinus]